MGCQDETADPPSAHSSYDDGASSLYSTPASIASFHQRYPANSRSYRPRRLANPQQSLSDLKSLLDILYTNGIPGPKLIRLQKEFSTPLGHGGQGNVYGVTNEFDEKARKLQYQDVEDRAKSSALRWTQCVVKRLRADQRRNDVHYAFREVSRLCHPSLRQHPNVVSLLSWGMSLDALETVNLDSLSTPLLILERSHCDLAQFIRSEDYVTASYELLCDLCLDIGRGLSAVHSTGIVHGDLKLENILIFPRELYLTSKWIAKLCDFGSAVPALADQQEVSSYLGSDTWLPPEWYERSLMGKPLPRSLIPCDIFVYGLVVWATFVGIHFSPLYNVQNVQGGADIVRHIGQQRFYARAKESVTACFSPTRSDTHQMLAAFTEEILSHFGGRVERQTIERRQQARRLGIGPFNRSHSSEIVKNKVRRILLVLRESLDDAPQRRARQPWIYFNRRHFSSIPIVDDPPHFKQKYPGISAATDVGHILQARVSDLSGRDSSSDPTADLQGSLETFSARCTQWITSTPAYIRALMRVLQQHSHRYKVYQNSLSKVDRLVPGFRSLSPFEYLEHAPEERHYDIAAILNPLEERYSRIDDASSTTLLINHTVNYVETTSSHNDMLYTCARIRSHFRLCCWEEYNRRAVKLAHLTVERYIQLGLTDLSVLAWMCRGEIGQYEVQQLKDSEGSIQHMWTHVTSKAFEISQRTEIFNMLLELGFDIHKTTKRATPFLRYLTGLDTPEKALDVAVHFQRVASDESSSIGKRYYLLGRTSDLRSDNDLQDLLNTRSTTALHDAVRAANYPLVEFLIRTRFNVSAVDSEGQLALDIAMKAKGATAQVNSIKALLQQTVHSQKALSPASPLGWEELHTENIPFMTWQETSIDGEFDAISFIAPKTGLYASDRLTLGRIQGEDQVYRLDPFRFLKASDDRDSERKPASKPHFCEDWYKKDIQMIERPLPFDPLWDERVWIRYPAKALRFVWSLLDIQMFLLGLFAFLSLIARIMAWRVPELLFAGLTIGIFSFSWSVSEGRVEKHINALLRNAPEFFIGISAVARGEISLARRIVFGFMLCNATWIPGVSAFSVGTRVKETLIIKGSRMMAEMLLVGFALFSILVWFDMSISVSNPGSLPVSADNTISLSRSIAIISLLFWESFVFFRNRTHADLFDFETAIDDNWPISDVMNESPGRSPANLLVQFMIDFILLIFCADTLVHGLIDQPHIAQESCAYFAAPLITRMGVQYRCIMWAREHRRYIELRGLSFAVSTLLYTSLFVGPCLVLFGWIMKVPMTLRFSLMEVALLDLAALLVSYLSQAQKTNYLSGVMLITLYILAVLALCLSL